MKQFATKCFYDKPYVAFQTPKEYDDSVHLARMKQIIYKELLMKDTNPSAADEAIAYHISVLTDHKIFSDEVDKQKFLSMTAQGKGRYDILAFSLLDDRFDLLVRNPDASDDPVTDAVTALMTRYREYYFRKESSLHSDFEVSINCSSIHDGGSLIETCLDIHALCMKENYVERLKDYWWTSYQTYRGEYDWKFVDVSDVLKRLDDKPEESRLALQKLQRRSLHGKSIKPLLAERPAKKRSR